MTTTILNPVCVLAFIALVAVLRGGPSGLQRVLSWGRTTAVVLVVALMSAGGLAVRVGLGYFAPGDFAQEVVAAQRFKSTGTFYTMDVSGDIRRWFQSEPPPCEAILPAGARQYVDRMRSELPALYGPQAHPPVLLLATWPIVAVAGGYGAYLFVAVLTVAAALASAWLVLTLMLPGHWQPWLWLALSAAVGWQPTLAAIRHGQVGVIIACLLVGAWAALRAERDFTAGVLVAVATALKVYPGVMAILFWRRPRAIAGLVLALGLAGVVFVGVAGLSEIDAYRHAALVVVDKYGGAHNNYSLWARLAMIGWPVRSGWAAAAVSGVLIGITLLARGGFATTPPGAQDEETDLRAAAMMCLALLLSPIAWQHYFFLLLLPVWVSARSLLRERSRASLALWCVALLLVSLPDTPFWWLDEMPGHSAVLSALLSPTTAIALFWVWCVRGQAATVSAAR